MSRKSCVVVHPAAFRSDEGGPIKGLETRGGMKEGGKKWRGRGTTTRSVKRARMKTKGWNGYGERGIKILEVREGWKNGNYFFVERYIYVRVCGWKEGGNF